MRIDRHKNKRVGKIYCCLSDKSLILCDSKEVMMRELLIGHFKTYSELLNIIALKL